jgi:hypothetical protein
MANSAVADVSPWALGQLGLVPTSWVWVEAVLGLLLHIVLYVAVSVHRQVQIAQPLYIACQFSDETAVPSVLLIPTTG